MESHPLPFAEPERSRLLPDRVRDADATEVVRECGAPHERHRLCREAHAPGGCLGEIGHARRMLAKPRRLETGERCDGREGGIDFVARDPICGNGSISSAWSHMPDSSRSATRSPKFRTAISASRGSYAAPARRSTTLRASSAPRLSGRGRCPSPRAGDASATGSRRRARPGIRVRPSARRRTRALPGYSARGRATRRTAAPPRTSPRTSHGTSGRRWR